LPLRLAGTIQTICLTVALAACGGGSGSGVPGTSPPPSGAVSWQRVNAPSAATQVNFFSISSGNHWFIADRNHGFSRSTDQGSTWTPINSGLATTLGWTINVNPANGDLIASTFSGSAINANPVTFYRSTDEGNSWSAIPYGHLSAATAQTGCAFAGNSNIVCGGYWAPSPASGAWISTDGGQTTTSVSNSSNSGTSVFGLGVNPSTHDLWLGTERNGIFRSTDNGATWTPESPVDIGLDPTNGIRDGNIFGITFDRNGSVLFGSQGGIWKSSNSGSGFTWTNVFRNQNTAAGKGLGRDATGRLYYGHNRDSSNPTVVHCSSDDGNTWSACDSGIPAGLEGHLFIVNPADRKLYAVIEDGATNNGWLYVTVNPVQ
jgi:photosystem II stability/assembly factor-like uncharacterized protein